VRILLFANTDWYLYNFRASLIERLSSDDNEVILVAPAGEYFTRLEAKNVKCFAIDWRRGRFSPWRELKVVFQLIRIYRQTKPTIAHHFTLKCIVYGTVASTVAGVPGVVNSITGLGYAFISDKIRTKGLRFCLTYVLRLVAKKKNSHLVVQNKADERLIQKVTRVSSHELHLIHGSGVNLEKYKPASSRSGSTKKVLMAARLLKDKGVREFIGAAREILERRGDTEFVLAGDLDHGNPASIRQPEIDSWKTIRGLTMAGHVRDIIPILQESDIFVLPSYREGFSKVLLEAAACQLPIVTTNVPGCKEIVDDGRTGILVDAGSVSSLVEAINRLLDSHETRLAMGKLGRAKICESFDEATIVSQTYSVYDRILRALP
jgi:glycosyltransferase involved in cell wall biosynthesis